MESAYCNQCESLIFTGMLPVDIQALPLRVKDLHKQLADFMDQHIYPNEDEFNRHQTSKDCWAPHPLVDVIKVGNEDLSAHGCCV